MLSELLFADTAPNGYYNQVSMASQLLLESMDTSFDTIVQINYKVYLFHLSPVRLMICRSSLLDLSTERRSSIPSVCPNLFYIYFVTFIYFRRACACAMGPRPEQSQLHRHFRFGRAFYFQRWLSFHILGKKRLTAPLLCF